jgi:tetratricopeptide (TPR) repeat protein
MSEHEYWNELGNLYFISGAYGPAIQAYVRSIELDRTFGRPYSNLALALVHTGKYEEALELYKRSLELLSDTQEKAITWNRLGFLFREIKDYQNAAAAYEQAAQLDSLQDELREEASRDAKFPLSIYMSALDVNAILERHEGVEARDENLPAGLNEELEVTESDPMLQWFEGEFAPPSPEPSPDYLAEENALLNEVSLSMEEEGWLPLVFEDALAMTGSLELESEWTREEAAAISFAWQTQGQEAVKEDKFEDTPIAGVDQPKLNEEGSEPGGHDSTLENQWATVNAFRSNDEPADLSEEHQPDEMAEHKSGSENQWVVLDENLALDKENVDPDGDTPEIDENEYQTDHEQVFPLDEGQPEVTESEAEIETQSVDVTEHETIQYSQVEYPLVERTPAEVNSIQIDVARFKRIIQINPRNAFAWETLGGLYKSLGKFKDAITSYQQALALDSTKPSYFYQLGLVYSAERRDQEAMDAFQRVLSMDPQHTLANASLGSYYRKMGLNDLAQKHIDIALKDVYEEENEYNQACLEAICGNTDRALELLQVAIEDNPTYINWAQHDPDLDILRNDQRFYMLIQSFAQAR